MPEEPAKITRRALPHLIGAGVAGTVIAADYFSGGAILDPIFGSLAYMLGGPSVSKYDIAPDFTLADLEGNSHTLSQYEGKPVVLNFWETWCGPCVYEMPTINEFAREYDGRVVTLAITRDDKENTREIISGWQEKWGHRSFPVLMDEGSMPEYGEVTDGLYGINGRPTTIILGADRRIENMVIGATDFMDESGPIRRTVDELLR